MRKRIWIPKNQVVKQGSYMRVMIIGDKADSVIIYLMAITDTSSASYDEEFYIDEYDPNRHGFHGIRSDLNNLVKVLK